MTGVTDRARDAYLLLTKHHPNGMTRTALAAALHLDDRAARKVIEALRTLAARHPHPTRGPLIIGYDPEQQLYTMAHDAEQAERIIAYELSYVRSQLAGIIAQVDAFPEAFGREPGWSRDVQEDLFGARRVLEFAR